MTYHRVCNKSNTTGATCVAESAYPSGPHEFTPAVLLDLEFPVWCVVDHCLSLCPFSSCYCIVCLLLFTASYNSLMSSNQQVWLVYFDLMVFIELCIHADFWITIVEYNVKNKIRELKTFYWFCTNVNGLVPHLMSVVVGAKPLKLRLSLVYTYVLSAYFS
jgi:hypothetical protein